MENATATLGDFKLLAVANGREHPDAACIVDVELMPELPPEHPQYSRRMETRTVAQSHKMRQTIENDSRSKWMLGRRFTRSSRRAPPSQLHFLAVDSRTHVICKRRMGLQMATLMDQEHGESSRRSYEGGQYTEE